MAFLEIAQGAVAALEAYKSIKENGDWLKRKSYRIARRLSNGKVNIPVFGAGGSGKSTLGRMLITKNTFGLPSIYAESRSVEKNEMQGWIPASLNIAPGQAARVSYTWPDLIRDINNGKSPGLINVVSFGYHAVEVPSIRSLDSFGKSDDFSVDFEVYTENRRAREVELLDYIYKATETAANPFWIITVVSKQDLWSHRHREVKEFYEHGPYADVLKKFEVRHGSAKFQHEIFNCSFTLGNFVTEREGIVAQNNAGYDLASHINSLIPFYQMIDHRLGEGNRK